MLLFYVFVAGAKTRFLRPAQKRVQIIKRSVSASSLARTLAQIAPQALRESEV